VQEVFADITKNVKDWTYTSSNSDVIYRVFAYKK